jgi:GntP family gluconate:H+ symporter
MIGRLLEVTGGAQVLADTLIGRFGEKRAPLALGVASLLFGFPIFFDAGLVVMLPIIFSVARRFGGSVLTYALPAAGAFAVMHAFVPPHPGPVAAGELLGADIGLLVIVGLVLALPTWYVGGYLFGTFTGRRFELPVPASFGATPDGDPDGGTSPGGGGVALDKRTEQRTAPAAPAFGTVLLVLLLPLVLIFLNTGITTLATAGAVDGDATWVNVLKMIGQTPVALLITVLVAMVLLGRGRYDKAGIEEVVNGALGPVCAIILITGAGGMFGGVLRASGIGEALAGSLESTGLPVIVAAFVVATALRVAQGSATVALTTTAGLIAPTVEATSGLSSLDLCFIVIAIACGSTVLSHVNDSGFWLVGRFLEMDEKTTLKTWTVMETILGTVGFVLALIGSLLL